MDWDDDPGAPAGPPPPRPNWSAFTIWSTILVVIIVAIAFAIEYPR